MSILANSAGKAYIVNEEQPDGTIKQKAIRMNRSVIYVKTTRGATVTCGQWTYTLGADQNTIGFNVEPGTYTITASKTGYDTETTTVTAQVGLAYNVNLSLFHIGYTELQYIQSTGTQYIDTGVIFTSEAQKKIIKFGRVAGVSSYPAGINGSQGSGNTRSFYIALKSSSVSSQLGIGIGNYGASGSSFVYDNPSAAPITLTMESTSSKVFSITDGETSYTGTYTGSAITGITDWIGMFHYFSADQFNGGAPIYSYQLYEDGVLVRNFIPAIRDIDSYVGMYDEVTENFYTNSGTGSFIAGPEV